MVSHMVNLMYKLTRVLHLQRVGPELERGWDLVLKEPFGWVVLVLLLVVLLSAFLVLALLGVLLELLDFVDLLL